MTASAGTGSPSSAPATPSGLASGGSARNDPQSSIDDGDDDDTELRDIVANVLRENGVLGAIKAQLRSSVYLALDDGKELRKKSSQVNHSLQSYLKTSDGRLVAHLVREFLAFFDLRHTLSVFDPEVMESSGSVAVRDRAALVEGLGLGETATARTPLLAEILRLSKVSVLKSETPTPTERTEDLEESMMSSLESNPAAPVATRRDELDLAPLSKSLDLAPLSKSLEKGSFSARNESEDKPKETSIAPVPKAASTLDAATAAPTPTPSTAKSQSTTSSSSVAASLSDLPKLSPGAASSSPLGALPPLGGVGGGKRALAPLKKIPSVTDTPKSPPKKEPTKNAEERPREVTLTATAAVFGRKEDDGGEDESVAEEVSIGEEIDDDDFLDSSSDNRGGGSTEEQVTKDETVSGAEAEASMAADYKEKF